MAASGSAVSYTAAPKVSVPADKTRSVAFLTCQQHVCCVPLTTAIPEPAHFQAQTASLQERRVKEFEDMFKNCFTLEASMSDHPQGHENLGQRLWNPHGMVQRLGLARTSSTPSLFLAKLNLGCPCPHPGGRALGGQQGAPNTPLYPQVRSG